MKKLSICLFALFIALTAVVFAAQIPSKGIVNASIGLNVRQSPSESAPVVGAFSNGAQVNIDGVSGMWYKVSGTDGNTGAAVSGYSHKNYIQVTGFNEQQLPEGSEVRNFLPTLYAVDPTTR